MRTMMLLGSVAMMGSGLFCIANGSAAFMSLAFVIGLCFCLVGLIEFGIGRRTDEDVFGRGVTIGSDGVLMFLYGAVLLAGQITDDTTALMMFALWLMIESILAVGRRTFEFKSNTRDQNIMLIDEFAMLVLSMLMFFNNRLLSIGAMMLIGVAMLLLGLSRAVKSFNIQYERPGFMTSNEEKLEEALQDEKLALAKAKEGIREQKEAQRRIEKIKKDMSMDSAAIKAAYKEKNR